MLVRLTLETSLCCESSAIANVYLQLYLKEFRTLLDRMRAFVALTLSVCVQICCGRYFNRGVFEYKPGIPMRDVLDEVCEDDPDYADACPAYAAVDNYCKDQEDFMRKNCPKSCGFCEKESIKPPAPAAVCEDDLDYADACPAYAAVENYCKDQKDFMKKNCPKSCGFCEKESIKPPAPAAVCEDDPDYADACPAYAAVEGYCKYHEEFMKKNCPKSCGLCEKESTKAPAPAAVCEDDPNYADACPVYAAVKHYCTDQEEFMKINCPKSCGLCEKATVTPAVSNAIVTPAVTNATVQPAAVSTESVKSPAPEAECKDDPEHEITCKDIAATAGLCKEQKQFTQEHCAFSCKWCESIKPPSSGAVCEDDPDYVVACPAYAAVEDYCTEHEEFMKINCPKSCGMCEKATVTPAVSNATVTPAVSNATVQPAAVSTESVKSPALAAECKDDPEHEITCKDIAATAGLCEEQKQFTQEHCAFSCKWCESPTTKAPIQEICGEDLPKWAARCPEWAKRGECDNPRVQVFLWHYCRKSCKLPCKTEPPPTSGTKPPSPPAFCRDRDINCPHWKSLGLCGNPNMPIYCGVTCDICKEPTPDQCFDKTDNCKDMKRDGSCTSSIPKIEYEVKTNCLKTCEFCVPDVP